MVVTMVLSIFCHHDEFILKFSYKDLLTSSKFHIAGSALAFSGLSYETTKAIAFRCLQLNYCKITPVTQKYPKNRFFEQNIFKKGFFWSKTEKVNISIEFSTFKLVSVPDFSINRQFKVFRPAFPKEFSVNITIYFSTLKLILEPNFSLNSQL